MTSIPASRSARAMIFAPRSCPSRPGFATTTRILRSAMEADSRGLLDFELHAHVGRMDAAHDRVGALLLHLLLEAAALLQRRLEARGPALRHDVVLVMAGPVPLDRRALLDRDRGDAAVADEEVVVDLDVARLGGGWGGSHEQGRKDDEGYRQFSHQNTGVSVYVPKTSWRASTISPSEACTRAHANRFGIRFWDSSAAAVLRSPTARSTAAASRRARTACTRPICLRSRSGSMRRISRSPSSPSR